MERFDSVGYSRFWLLVSPLVNTVHRTKSYLQDCSECPFSVKIKRSLIYALNKSHSSAIRRTFKLNWAIPTSSISVTMPTLNLFTNVPVDSVVAADTLKDASKAVSKILGKPESYVMILLNGSTPIVFSGTEEPAAYAELISNEGLGPSVNGKLSSTIAEIIQTKLHIDSSRFYVKFSDVQASYVGDNGSTF